MIRIDRNKLREHCAIHWTFEPEIIPVRGNVMASGDDAFDEQCEDLILERLDRCDPWAWFTARCTASFQGIEKWDSLGCCSYADEKDFMAGDYAESMVGEAIEQLAKSLETAHWDIETHLLAE